MDNLKKDPKQDFMNYWTNKQKAGFKNYMAVGFMSCVAFFFFAIAVASFIMGQKAINLIQTIVFLVLSIILPLVAWFFNEFKFKKLQSVCPTSINNEQEHSEKQG
jgi:hypothetical protein